jgi:hypothetical protein
MVIRKSWLFDLRLRGSVSLVFLFSLSLVMIEASGCSNSGSTSDGSGEGGHGGASGLGTGGASGEAGHSGTGGTAGVGSGGAAGSGAGGTSGGSGGVAGSQTYSCGYDTCTVGQSFCYSYAPGTAGPAGLNCQPTPSACASAATSCACLCPPSTSLGLGCVPFGMNPSAFCTCEDTDGVVNVSCAGS